MTVDDYLDHFARDEQAFFSYLAAAVLEAEGPVRRHHIEARMNDDELLWLETATFRVVQMRLVASELIRMGADAEGRSTYYLTLSGRALYSELQTYYDSSVILAKPGRRSRPSALAEGPLPHLHWGGRAAAPAKRALVSAFTG
jgi:hypothetical protein